MDDPPTPLSYPPWSDLPKEMLALIFDRVKDPVGLLGCLGVCTSWHSVVSMSLRKLLINLPPLILFPDTIKRDLGSGNIATEKGIVFYSCQSRNGRKFSLPAELRGSWISGSSHGWVIVQRHNPHEIWLINAVSHAQIRLPNADEWWWPTTLRIILSANPASDPNCMILAVDPHAWFTNLAFCRLGDSSWTEIDNEYGRNDNSATFYRGKFHVYCRSGQMLQIDLTTSSVPEIVTLETRGVPSDPLLIEGEEERDRKDYLMESSGELLLVSKYVHPPQKITFKVHKFDYQKSEWIEVEDLGNRALFVGYNNSISVLLEADEDGEGSTGCRANCIYFIDDSKRIKGDIEDYPVHTNKATNRGIYDMSVREFGWIPGVAPVWFNDPLSWICPEI